MPYLHNPHKVVEWLYKYCITVETDGEYWDISLKETEATGTFVKQRIWTMDNQESLTAALSMNSKDVIITFPDGTIRTVRISEEYPPHPTHDMKVKRIKEDKIRREKVKEFHGLLKTLGISFKIDFHTYREDSDRMTVYVDGEEVFSGITDDLQNHKE